MIRFLSKAEPKLFRGATALLRLDFNTKDDWRMRAVLPTIQFLQKHAGKIVVVSHRGRPSGFERSLTLQKDAPALGKLIKKKVVFVPHFRFAEISSMVATAPAGSVFLVENLRFLPGEEANDQKLARELASLADFYVNDAFAVSHRANASVTAITKFLPSYAGMELEKEIESLSRVMLRPKRPLLVLLGGAKAGDKLGVIQYFEKRADWFLLGGGPANTILSMKGIDVQNSVRDRDPKDLKVLAPLATQKNIVVPDDLVWHDGMVWDIGQKAVQIFSEKIAKAGTILWSGPLGLIEKKKYAKGSIAIAHAIARNHKVFSVAGGGETVMFLKKYKLDGKFSFISTGGGAMVDYLAGKKLPGIEALR